MGVDVIDLYEYHGAMAYEHVIGNPTVMERMARVGQNIAAALKTESAEERIRYRGEQEGVCPVCHCDLLTVLHEGNKVECPVCGIEGTLEMVNGQIKATFSAEQQKRSRLFYAGKLEHSTEIKTKAAHPGQIPDKAERLAKYKGYGVKI